MTTPSRMLPVGTILARTLAAHPGRDFVMYSGTAHERTIRLCARGDVLEGDEHTDFEALSSGIYARLAVHRGDTITGHRWLRLCACHELADLIEADRPIVGDLEIAGLAPAAAWWSSCSPRSSTPSTFDEAE